METWLVDFREGVGEGCLSCWGLSSNPSPKSGGLGGGAQI